MTGAVIGTVSALWRYPVKSMMGEMLDAAPVTGHGLLGDRAYALIERATGRVASAKLAARWGRLLQCRAAYAEPPRAGGPLPALRITLPDGTSISSRQPDAEARLSRALGREAALQGPRPEEPHFDAEPIHLLSTASLERLRGLRPEGRFDPRRFRPNFVISLSSGESGFPEERWIGRTIALGGEVRLRIASPCERCVMTTLAQADLAHDPGILHALARHNGANVGVYAAVVSAGQVRCGDPVRLL
jgi:uncharacterized protein YcbX